MLVRLLRIFQTYCFMINSLRRLIWKFLGINFYNFLKNKKHINLKDADWVQLGKNSYDNGAYVWRWNTDSELIIGNFCSIANDVHFICDSGYHGESKITSFPLFHEILDKEDEVLINNIYYKVKDIVNQLHLKSKISALVMMFGLVLEPLFYLMLPLEMVSQFWQVQ